jgi:hypothetical protein
MYVLWPLIAEIATVGRYRSGSFMFATILNAQSLRHRGHRGRARGHRGNASLCELGLVLRSLSLKIHSSRQQTQQLNRKIGKIEKGVWFDLSALPGLPVPMVGFDCGYAALGNLRLNWFGKT